MYSIYNEVREQNQQVPTFVRRPGGVIKKNKQTWERLINLARGEQGKTWTVYFFSLLREASQSLEKIMFLISAWWMTEQTAENKINISVT